MKLKNLTFLFITFLLIQLTTLNTYSVEPEEILENKQQEMRARYISKNIRCMICQNQSIDESMAPLAKDLRILIRKKIQEGHTDKEIIEYLTNRYGDFILLKPPLKLSTLALWLFPFIFFILGIYFIYNHNIRSKKN